MIPSWLPLIFISTSTYYIIVSKEYGIYTKLLKLIPRLYLLVWYAVLLLAVLPATTLMPWLRFGLTIFFLAETLLQYLNQKYGRV